MSDPTEDEGAFPELPMSSGALVHERTTVSRLGNIQSVVTVRTYRDDEHDMLQIVATNYMTEIKK